MQASQIPQPVSTPSHRTLEIQPDTGTHQHRQVPHLSISLAPNAPPLWMQVKLQSLGKKRSGSSLRQAKAVKNFYLDFLAAIRQTSRPPALPGSRNQLISSRIKESMALEISHEFIDLRKSLALKLASLQKRQAKFQTKKMNPLVRFLLYPKYRLLDKKLQTCEGAVRDIIRITQKLQVAIRDAQTDSNRQNQN